MARNDSVTRILKAIHYLEIHPHGLGVNEIHAKLGSDGFAVSERTVYRDIEVIQSIHLPLVKHGEGPDSKWKLEQVATIHQKLHFSYQELIALFLAKESLGALRESPLFGPINSFFSRIEKTLGVGALKEIENFRSYVGFKPAASWQSNVSSEILATIYDACAEGHVIEVGYRAISGSRKDVVARRRLGPEGIYFADSGAYLIAMDLDKGEHRTFALSRIADATILDEAYLSGDFSVKDFLRDSMGALRIGAVAQILLEVREPIASYLSERRWHESQTVKRVADGVELCLEVRINEELARWVLGLGPAVVRIEPLELREWVGEMASRIAAQHGRRAA